MFVDVAALQADPDQVPLVAPDELVVTPPVVFSNVCSMTVPAFDERGLLPPTEHGEGYVCTPSEIRQRFVVELGDTVWRASLFQGWDELRPGRSVVPSAWWWLWGCFVSDHVRPLWGDDEVRDAVVVLAVQELVRKPEHGEMVLSVVQGARRRQNRQTWTPPSGGASVSACGMNPRPEKSTVAPHLTAQYPVPGSRHSTRFQDRRNAVWSKYAAYRVA